MESKEIKDKMSKKNRVVHITILIVIISLIVIAILLASSSFNFVDFVLKLHGG